jgi:hypothetical protein
MRTDISSLAALVALIIFLASLRGTSAGADTPDPAGTGSRHPELEYLKAVNSVAPPLDPQLLFLLMGQYSNAKPAG